MIELWDGAVAYEEPVLNPETEAIKAEVEAELTEFQSHRKVLISCLREAYDDARTEPFDEDNSWHRIDSVAHMYFWQCAVKRKTKPPMSFTDCANSFQSLATMLQLAGAEFEQALNTPALARPLESAWWKSAGDYIEATGRSGYLLWIEHEFRNVVGQIGAFERAARNCAAEHAQAAQEARRGRGRPRGSFVFPREFIHTLAYIYRESTGVKPGAGGYRETGRQVGPFARFVCAFLDAMGVATSKETVIDAIKDARKTALKNTSRWGPSPFDD